MRWILPTVLLIASCQAENAVSRLERKSKAVYVREPFWINEFSRHDSNSHLLKKIQENKPLVVHTLVPLCDNTYQGIAPTSASLGDGFNLKTNLYWATRHGMKRYFQLQNSWRELQIDYVANDTILERVVFERKFENGARVVLINDAYRGDQMSACISDYFQFLGGYKNDSIGIDKEIVYCGLNADMLVFNGHNGMYEANPEMISGKRHRHKDAVVIACSSYYNFTSFIKESGNFPLVTTTQSLYPGATVLDYIIERWALLHAAEEIRFAAAQAYDNMKDCGIEAADNMFHSGW